MVAEGIEMGTESSCAPMPRAEAVAPGQWGNSPSYANVVPLIKQRLAGVALWAGWAGLFKAQECVVDGWGPKPLGEAELRVLFGAVRLMEHLEVQAAWMLELEDSLVAVRQVGAEHWVIATARPGLRQVFLSALDGVARELAPLIEQLEV